VWKAGHFALEIGFEVDNFDGKVDFGGNFERVDGWIDGIDYLGMEEGTVVDHFYN